jgi:hypothetical protein
VLAFLQNVAALKLHTEQGEAALKDRQRLIKS